MTKVSRRGFLAKTSLSAAAVGALTMTPGLTADAALNPAQPAAELSRAELRGPIVAQVRNLATGEIALMVGTREIVYHDRKLVRRLIRAAR